MTREDLQKKVGITWVGYRDYDSANEMLQQAGEDYAIVKITTDSFDGEVLGYVVMRKDVDPVGGASMNNYDVIRMAAEVMPEKVMPATPEELAEFARIVAANEREACAKLCEGMARDSFDIRGAALEVAAERIRARGE